MSEPPANVEPAPNENPQQGANTPSLFTTILRMMVIWWAIGWIQHPDSMHVTPPSISQCVWPLGTKLNLLVYVSDQANFQDFDNRRALILEERNLVFGDRWDYVVQKSVNLSATPSVQNNGSLYAHVYVMQEGADTNVDSTSFFYKRKLLTRYLPRKKITAKKNLISASESESVELETLASEPMDERDGTPIVSYWYPNLTMNMVYDASPLPIQQISQLPHLAHHLQFATHDRTKYFPLFYLNDFWTITQDIYAFPINETVETLPLHISFYPMGMWKFQWMVQMEASFQLQKTMMGIQDDEIDKLRSMLFETNPYLLALTMFVSLLHSLFDFLAFKNDIQFWKDGKNIEGLSLRSILLSVGMQFVIFLYLLDNDTSWLILSSTAIGLVIDVWKVRKALALEMDWSQHSLGGLLPFRISLRDRNPPSKLRSKTNEYDAVAFRYLGWASIPLVLGYAAYSLVYESHKGWYSWVLGTAVGFVYTFGFITMTPQLFINCMPSMWVPMSHFGLLYDVIVDKLKSVAHMPWRTLIYKSLNTFIDDLFAFIIKMPWLHRLACFRDDVIFLIYLYQRWIYPEDKTRANEYGQVGEVQEEKPATTQSSTAEKPELEEESKKTK